jgi:quercetin dioxygenase-like cupin family protein
MPFVDTRLIEPFEKRPGWRGRIFSSPGMTFAHWEFDAGAEIHEHDHLQEEVWHVLSGQLEVTVGGETTVAGAGMVAIVPPWTPHKVTVLKPGKAIVVDNPVRPEFGPTPPPGLAEG